jgi:alkanesulfonate monooxygenase SsuD/methylene tetrahydromethanopterin reductase-like flavin-dependent oxidoreductase (luciferase family)
VKFGIQFQLQTPRPYDADSWGPDDEAKIFAQALEQIEHADRLGFDYVFLTEHHFLEEYCHSAAPEVVLAAAAARTKQIRLGHGIVQMPPAINHPARVAERIASLDIVSGGRVEFGTGEGATETEIGGFGVLRAEKKEAWEEATRECLRMMHATPYPGYEGTHFSMPERNIVPKPLQRPHPPVWVAASRRETVMLAARMGIGAMGFGFETPQEAEERVQRYYELIRACRRPLGQTINPALMTLGNMMCAPTDEEAIAKGLRGAQYFGYVFGWMHGHQNHGRDNIYRDFRRKQEAATATLEAQDSAVALEPEDESARALYRMGRRGMFMGSPEYIRENIRAYERAHVDVLLFLSQCGDRRHEDIMESLELFAKEVMPEFKERHHLQQRWRDEQLDGVQHPIASSV